MSVLLPPTIAIKTGWGTANVYMNYNDDSDSQTRGVLKFNGGNVFSPLAKFEVVAANTRIGMVHIRCSHNKKFLRVRAQGNVYISPDADEPEEDQSRWSCTLLQPRLVDGNPDCVRLFHVQRQQYLVSDNSYDFHVGLDYPAQQDVLEIIDLESLVILPRHVAFKGDNGKYLGMVSTSLLFATTEKGTATTWFEVFTDVHGRAQIKSYKTQTFLRYDKDMKGIWASTTDTTDDQTTFWPVKVDKNVFALRSFANNCFCGRVENQTYDFDAVFPTISKESHLELEELVLSRRMYNVDYDLDNAVIYGETFITMATENASNKTLVDNTVEFKFTYTESKSSTWTSSNSWKAGMSVEAQLKIPFFSDGKVTVSGEYSGSYVVGETITSQNTLETTYRAVVPANDSITVSLIATKGSCNVPYSYYQRDVLYNGKAVVYKKDDGLYTGKTCYNFKYIAVPGKKTSRINKRNTSTTYMVDEIVMPSEVIQGSLGKTTEENGHVPLPREETTQEQKLSLPSEEMVEV